ncbi:MAG: hypothetical protein ACI8TX_003945, partial [Hyphomicrobiaceae bacterium]
EAESVKHSLMIWRIRSHRKGCVWTEKPNEFGPDGVLASDRAEMGGGALSAACRG